MTACTYWSQVLVHRSAPDERQITISGFDACFLSVALKFMFALSFYATNWLPFTRVKWNLHWVRTSVLSCKGVTIGSLCCLLIHLGLREDFSSCQCVEWKKCCVLWQEAWCCRTTRQSFLTSYKDDSTKQSTLEETMNFFNCNLMALQQPSKSAFLHRSAPLLIVSCTYFWSWQQ